MKRSARLLFVVTLFFWCSQYSYTQFINPELARLGTSASFMGLVAGMYGLVQTLLRLPLGVAADRLGRQKPFVVLGTLLPVFAGAFLLRFYTPAGFFVLRLLSGAAAASWVSFTVLYSSYFPPDDAPGRISYLNLSNLSGKLAGFAVMLVLVPALGVRSAFAFSMAAAALAFLMAAFLKEPASASAGISLRELLAVSRDRNLRACSILGAMTQAVAFATYYGFTVNVALSLGAGSQEVTLLNIALLAPGVLATFFSSRLIGRYKAGPLVSLGCFLGGAYALLVPFAASVAQLYLLQVVAGVSSMLTFGVLLGQPIRDIQPERRAAAMGFYQSAYGVGMTVGPAAMGLFISLFGLRPAFLAAAALSVLTGLMSMALLRETNVLSRTIQ